MGGFGSGQRWSKKRTVESCDAIDTAALRRWKLLVPGVAGRTGTLHWGRGEDRSSVAYVLTVGRSAGVLRLAYGVGLPRVHLDYSVRLVTTPCHLGGVRWWLICPLVRDTVACGRRVRKLYRRGSYFGCRSCHGLAYRSSQQSDSRVYALARAGLDAMPQPGAASVKQLGLALKALALMRRRWNVG